MKNLATLLFVLLTTISHVNADQETEKLKAYVEHLTSQSYDTFNDKNLSEQDRVKQSSQLIQENLHLDWMAKYTLGRHRRVLSQDKINEFLAVYSQFVVKAYSDLSRHYKGEKATIKKVKQIDDNMFIVSMEILQPNSESTIKVDYLVHKLKNAKGSPYRVADIITEGISILNSQQSEFNSVISNQGIDSLIDNLRQKVNT